MKELLESERGEHRAHVQNIINGIRGLKENRIAVHKTISDLENMNAVADERKTAKKSLDAKIASLVSKRANLQTKLSQAVLRGDTFRTEFASETKMWQM